MIVDLRQEESGRRIATDLCIIGGGAAGITIAQSFADLGVQVCLVESGGVQFEDETQQLYAGVSIGKLAGLESCRLRFLGGTTNHWGGRCAGLSEAEMANRSWISYSGWPIGLDDLRPYYQRARGVCGFTTDWQSDERVLNGLGIALPAAGSSDVLTQIWRFAPHDGGAFWNWGSVYREKLQSAANIRVLLHANLVEFTSTTDASHISEITVKSLTGISAKIAARYYILCCGGIENARLLLVGSEHAPEGFWNAHDLVGRFFMQHLRADAAVLFTADRLSPVQDLYNDFIGPDAIQYEVGLTLSAAAQQKQELLNSSAILQYHGDPEAGITAAQDIWRRLQEGHWASDLGAKVWHVVRDLQALRTNGERRLFQHRHPLLPLESVGITVDIEQAPNPDSRITLGQDRDQLGMRKIVVDWRLSALERKTARYFMIALGSEFARRGIGRLRLEPWLDKNDATWQEAINETCHHIGSTRMSDDPSCGVVDSNCRVHGMDNLYVAGSSVFPTGGHVNPTFTIVALALRLGDHIKAIMARR
jgi:choline dehydrogenase-like flavoprotein